jgi:hypothetical protein
VWGSFLLWRKMTGSRRLAVKAGADLVFALLLGAQAVLLLVWLANLLGMPRPEVLALRAVLGRAGRLEHVSQILTCRSVAGPSLSL